MRHTRGPWTAIMSETANGAPDTARIKNADGVGVAITNHANAQLIAAAPEMLEALELLLTELDESGSLDCLSDTTRDSVANLIMKARGKS